MLSPTIFTFRYHRIPFAVGIITLFFAFFSYTYSPLILMGLIKTFIVFTLVLSIGLWIENSLGFLYTLLIFTLGIIIGQTTIFLLNVNITTNIFTFGFFSFLGTYCSLQGRQELRFLFLFKPIKIKDNFKIFQLALPFSFIIINLLLSESAANYNEIIIANFSSFLFGTFYGFTLMNKIPLKKYFLSPNETMLIRLLEKEKHSPTFLNILKSIMKWNPQNLEALKLFLIRFEEHPLIIKKESDRLWLEKTIAFALQEILRNGRVQDKLAWLTLIPQELEFDVCLNELTIDDIIDLSSQSIEHKNIPLAKKLLISALEKTPNAQQENTIHENINNLNSYFRGFSKAS